MTASEELAELRQRLAEYAAKQREREQQARRQWGSFGLYAKGQFKEMGRVAEELEQILAQPAAMVAEPVFAFGEREEQ